MEFSNKKHSELILEQFSKQAIPFSNIPGHSDEKIASLIIDFSGVTKDDIVLDVACGPGLVTIPFARIAKKATGMDITPEMINRAKEIQEKEGITNIAWDIGNAYSLPYDDNSFSMAVTRYSFHHLLKPFDALKEMARVCRPGGKVVVIDVSPPLEKQAAYDSFEKLRDPSHTKALAPVELIGLFENAALENIKTEFYLLERELENQIECSFPNEGDDDRMRDIIRNDLLLDNTGFAPKEKNGSYYLYYPNIICLGQKTTGPF